MKQTKSLTDKIEHIIIKSLITLGLTLLLLLWGAIPILILKIFNVDANNISESMKIILTFVFDLLFLILIGSIYHKTLIKDFKEYFNKKNFRKYFKQSFKTWLIGLGVMMASNAIIMIFTKGTLSNNEETVRTLIDSYPLYMAFNVMIYAPITEELIFRKSIKDIFPNSNLSIIISGLIFGGLHVITSLDTPLGLLHLIPYCSLGFIFAYLYKKTDNIFSTITAHSIHNTFAILIYLRGIK